MSRRLVVVLFLDLVGWTRLAERVDPEPLQMLLEQYYGICSAAIEEHGGTVEKFIGDAVMAVFGAATSQEDDALRALRAAVQIREDVGELHDPDATVSAFEIHCGLAAGEALVTQSPRAGLRVVGDVVNLAARLQSTAAAGEILVNDTVADLARPHVGLEAVAPLTLKGKATPVPAWLVTGPSATAGQYADPLHMIDRSAERARLSEIYRRVAGQRRLHTVVVLGPPGIGKTRLISESIDEFAATAAARPRVVVGTCPSYGANGTHAALGQVLEAVARRAAASRELARTNHRVAAVLTSLRTPAPHRRAAAPPGPGVEEVGWAARALLAAAAAEQPLVVVWDSLEWAGPSLLHLIGELRDALRDCPLLMVCAGRPEFAERDVRWLRARDDLDVIEVGALAPSDSSLLAASLTASGSTPEVQAHALDLVDRVAVYSAGNPLFIRLLLESAIPGEPPPTIVAMVSAMIDRLPEPARRLLVAASVIGTTFVTADLALLGERVPADALGTLLERRLIRPSGDVAGYCFVQQPVHEVAYGRLEKERRLSWHRCLAEHDVSPAFHFEAAVRLLGDLRPHDAELPRLAAYAADALLQEGTDALRQRDIPAAIALLERAVRMPVGPHGRGAVAAIRLSDALLLAGDTRQAVEVAATAERSDGADVLPCRVQRHLLAARLDRVTVETIDRLHAELRDGGADHLAWCRFAQLRMMGHLEDGHFGDAEQAARTALGHARSVGDAYEEDRLLAALCEIRQWSPTPITERLSGCRELADRFAADRFLLVPVLTARARSLALIGEHAGAQAALDEAGTAVEQLRLAIGRILVNQAAGLAGSLRGDHVTAERHFRWAADALERAGYAPPALTSRVQAARELARRDPLGSAAADEIAVLLAHRDEMDVRGRVLCLSAAIRLDATAVGTATAEHTDRRLDEVRSMLDDTDDPCLRGEVYFDLAETYRHRGEAAASAAMAAAAFDSYAVIGATHPMRAVQSWT